MSLDHAHCGCPAPCCNGEWKRGERQEGGPHTELRHNFQLAVWKILSPILYESSVLGSSTPEDEKTKYRSHALVE